MDSGAPFYLATSVNDSEFDLSSEEPQVFETLEDATAYANAEHAEYGVGMVVFYCRPAYRVLAVERDDDDAAE
jgi:hypothetical protein